MTRPTPGRRPSPPASLSLRAREEWHRLAPIAHEMGTLTRRSAKAFEILVEVLATERQARELVASEGIAVKTGRAGMKPHPALRAMETARAHAAVLMRQFRLEPPKVPNTAPSPKPKGKSTWSNVLK